LNNKSEAWDGTYLGKPLPDGVYYYILKYDEDGGLRPALSGFITIHR